MNIIFRVDSSKEIGAGHSMRCYALAEEFLRNNHKVIFISNSQLDFVKQKLESKNIIIEKIKKTDPIDEIEKVIKLLEKYKSDFLILDGYNFDYNYQKAIKEKNIKIVYITDLKGKYYCDILICPTPGLKPSDFKSPIKTKYFLGPQYVFLRDEILKCKSVIKRMRKTNIKNILVSFGAGLLKIIVIKNIIGIIENNFSNCIIKILIGSKENKKIIQKILSQNLNNKYELLLPKEVKTDVFKNIDLAFSTASTTLWELLYLKIPTICYYTNINQKKNAEWLNNNKYVINLGNLKKYKINKTKKIFNYKNIINFCNKKELLSHLIKNKIYLELISNILNLKFRKATSKDCKFIWSLRNDENIRYWSFNNNFISFKEHIIWYKKKLKDKNSIIFILLKNKNKVGYIRYDIKKNNAEIDIAIRKEYHGKHIGSNGLKLTGEYIKNNYKIKKLIARIKNENIASIKCFEKAGYILERKNNNYLEMIF